MQSMFTNTAFSSLDLSSFNTKNVVNMNSMFQRIYNLRSLNVSKFDTSQVTDMFKMFDSCSLLQKLEITNFRTE